MIVLIGSPNIGVLHGRTALLILVGKKFPIFLSRQTYIWTKNIKVFLYLYWLMIVLFYLLVVILFFFLSGQ